MPESLEARWGRLALASLDLSGDPAAGELEGRLQAIVDRLAAELPPSELAYTVHVADSPEANAAVIPGGHIIVMRGLVDEVQSENELAMILGHELGHMRRRHHLKRAGSLTGHCPHRQHHPQERRPAVQVRRQLVHHRRARGSRATKSWSATHWGSTCCTPRTVTWAAASDFFARHADEDGLGSLVYFRTHPLSGDRIELLRAHAERSEYTLSVRPCRSPAANPSSKPHRQVGSP